LFFRSKQRLDQKECQPEKDMKRISLITLFIAFILFAGCRKRLNEQYSDSLVGSWELFSVEGGMRIGPITQPPYSSRWIFTDSTYKHILSDSLIGSGDYMIRKSTDPQTGKEVSKLIFDINNPDPNLGLPFDISKNVLSIYRGWIAADGVIEKYRRVQND